MPTFDYLLLDFENSFCTESGQGTMIALNDSFQSHVEVLSEHLKEQLDFDVVMAIVVAGRLKLIFCVIGLLTTDMSLL